MRSFIKLTQDATIYQRFPTRNTGLDEILEIGKAARSTDNTAAYTASAVRSLLQFDIGPSYYTSSAKYYLNLYLANASKVNRYQKINVHLVSGSWVEGSAYASQDVQNTSDGVTWYSASNSTAWNVDGADYSNIVSSSFTFTDVPINNVKIDITNLLFYKVNPSSSIDYDASGSASFGTASASALPTWNGLLIKFPTTDETDAYNVGNIKFFSSNTQTIFEPNIEVVWGNQTFVTGSLKPIPNGNVSILPKNIKESYTQGEVDKIYLIVRDKFPDKRFDSTQRYKNTYYLPSESYFRIRDQASDTEIYKFDAYSAINCDTSGSYIVLDTNGLNVNRYYTIDLKVKSTDLVFFPEFKYTFKIDVDD